MKPFSVAVGIVVGCSDVVVEIRVQREKQPLESSQTLVNFYGNAVFYRKSKIGFFFRNFVEIL